MTVPAQLLYSSDHEWIAVDGTRARIGITDYAQDALGDVVFVQAPAMGRTVTAGDSSARSRAPSPSATSTRPCPEPSSLSTRRSANGPDALNSDPYGAGWICEIEMSNPADVDGCSTPLAIKLSSTVSLLQMAYVFCNQCGHRNPPESGFCSSCGSVLDRIADHTITLAKVDPLQDAPGVEDDVVVSVGDLAPGVASLIVRSGAQAGDAFALHDQLTRLGRHPDSEISLDDITVSRRHAEVERTDNGYVVRDAGSLNGTYVNAERIDDEVVLHQGDELQVGKFRLVFFERSDG